MAISTDIFCANRNDLIKVLLEKGHRIGYVMVWHCIRVRLAWEWLEISMRHQYKSKQEPKINQSNPVPLLYARRSTGLDWFWFGIAFPLDWS